MFYQLIATNRYEQKTNLIFGTFEGLAAYVADRQLTVLKVLSLTEEEFNKLAEED